MLRSKPLRGLPKLSAKREPIGARTLPPWTECGDQWSELLAGSNDPISSRTPASDHDSAGSTVRKGPGNRSAAA